MEQRPYRLWIVAFVGFFLTIGAWALAAPYDASADEHDHVYRAAAIWDGDVAPQPAAAVRGSGAFVTVPGGLVRPKQSRAEEESPVTGGARLQCWVAKVGTPAACADPPGSDRTPVRVPTGAGRYHPVYYALVGLPLKLWPGWPGVLLARLISAALSAALLAGAVVAIVRHTRHRLMLTGVLVSVTPTAMHFMAAVNPNGLEIAAAIAFFAGVFPLCLRPLPDNPRGLLALTGISALLLAMLRPTGIMLMAPVLVGLLWPFRYGNAAALWRVKAARWWALALVLVSVGTFAWIVLMRGADMGTEFRSANHWSAGAAVLTVTDRWTEWVQQAIGLFSWYDVRAPQPVYLVWMFVAAALLVFAIAVGRWIDRWRLFVTLVGAVLLPTAIQVYAMNSVGLITQGRYVLPMLAGVMLMSGYVLEERLFDAARSRSVTRLFVLALLPLDLFCLVLMMVRWQRGLPQPFGLLWMNPLAGPWHPVVGSATVLVVAVLGLAALGWLVWREASASTAI